MRTRLTSGWCRVEGGGWGMARPRRELSNSTVCARKYYAEAVSRTTDNAGVSMSEIHSPGGRDKQGRSRATSGVTSWLACESRWSVSVVWWQQVACSLAARCCVRFLVGGCEATRKSLAVSWLGWQGESSRGCCDGWRAVARPIADDCFSCGSMHARRRN